MNVLDLFSGIGGFSLGLERAGFKTVAFCEVDPWCRRVLAKHWPRVPIYDDVRELDAARLRADGIPPPDAICGGFPCQDVSFAGKGAGLAGERSGLWREFARLVRELRPEHVIVENVAALLGRGHGEVVGDLASLGYCVEWHCVPAAAVGAPHRRDRVWIVASATNADGGRCERERLAQHDDEQGGREPDGLGARGWRHWSDVADAARQRVQGHGSDRLEVALAPAIARLLGRDDAARHWREWTTEPALRRVDDGSSSRLDRHRLKALGNAVVPQIPELIGRALMEAHQLREAA